MAEFDFAAHGRFRAPWRRGRHVRESSMEGLASQNVVQPAHGSRAALKNIGDEPERDHGEDQLDHVGVKGHEFAERNLLADHLPPPNHSTSTNVMPISAVSAGMNMLQVAISFRLRVTYSRLGASKPRISASSWA